MEQINYLSAFKTEKEMMEALKIIRNTASSYYKTNMLKFKQIGYDVDDLETTIHEHLLIKFNNSGFVVNSFGNLKYMCKMSMNAVLRNIALKFGKELTKEEREDKHLNTIKTEEVRVQSLSEMSAMFENSSDFEDNILTDHGEQEEICMSKVQVTNFCNLLSSRNPEYETVFKINSYLNTGINLYNDDAIEQKIFDVFRDLIINSLNLDNLNDEDEDENDKNKDIDIHKLTLNDINNMSIKNTMKPKIKVIETKIDKKTGKKVEKASFKKQPDVVLINRRKIRINEIIKRLGLHITAKEYEETYKIVCKLMKRQLKIKRKISKPKTINNLNLKINTSKIKYKKLCYC